MYLQEDNIIRGILELVKIHHVGNPLCDNASQVRLKIFQIVDLAWIILETTAH
jgi:hypothetical protein